MSAIDLACLVLPDSTTAREALREFSIAALDDGLALLAQAGRMTWAAHHVREESIHDLEHRRKNLHCGEAPRQQAGADYLQWYFHLLNAAHSDDRAMVCSTLSRGPGTAAWSDWQASSFGVIPGTRIALEQDGPRPKRAAEAFARRYSNLYGKTVAILPITLDRFAAGFDGEIRVAKLADAVGKLALWFPEARACLDELTSSITLLEGPYLVGGTDLSCFGTTFLNLNPSWSVLCYTDHLVHEAAHQALHAAAEVVPPLINPADMAAPSPIRPDPRPLNGTLHATVVFSWLVELCARVLSQTNDPNTRDEATARLHRHYLGYLQGCEGLEAHAEWTEAGRGLWRALADRRDRLQADLGDPDPLWYERIPGDYELPSTLKLHRSQS